MTTAIEVKDVQSLVFSGHGRLQHALAIGMRAAEAKEASRTLLELVRNEVAFGMSRGGRTVAAQVGLSAAGIAALEGSAAALEGLEVAFREGMVTPQRSRALGDLGGNRPEAWHWQDTSVHALLLVYARGRAAVEAERDRILQGLTGAWSTVFQLPIRLPEDGREPFGFRDGISNVRVDLGDGSGTQVGVDLVPPGEILLGHRTAVDVVLVPPPLGVNGTYLVVRQLEQDVEGFWKFWRGRATSEAEAIWLAAKSIGRWPNGMPLRGGAPGAEPPAVEEEIAGPLSFDRDPQGVACPLGAHIRRANPRGAIGDDPERSRQIVAHHRLIRRGRVYGPPAPGSWYPKSLDRVLARGQDAEPTGGRGLFFMSLCGDIARQFEFMQQTWLNNPKFADLYDEVDAAAAGEGIPQDSRRFSIQSRPLRRRIHGLPHWVSVRAGGYFLLPGRRALEHWLANGH